MKIAELFRKHVIEPVLDHLDSVSGGKGKLNTESAIVQILMICAHESALFTYSRQLRGPAMGFTQMEPATHDWLVEWLQGSREHLLDGLNMFTSSIESEQMIFNPNYAVAMARLNLLRFPEALPAADDLEGHARYAKKYWNTHLGKASEEDYLKAYLKLIG